MELGLDQMLNGLPNNNSLPKPLPRPKDIRITQVVGGFTISKFGNEFYPLEVCVSIGEVLTKVQEFFIFSEPQDITEPTPEQSTEQSTEQVSEVGVELPVEPKVEIQDLPKEYYGDNLKSPEVLVQESPTEM